MISEIYLCPSISSPFIRKFIDGIRKIFQNFTSIHRRVLKINKFCTCATRIGFIFDAFRANNSPRKAVEFDNAFNDVKRACQIEFGNEFQIVNQSISMQTTRLKDLKDTMIADLSRISLTHRPLLATKVVNLVTADDVKIMKEFRENLENIIKNEADDNIYKKGRNVELRI